VAALQRALSLAQVDRVAVVVGEDLHLDVSRVRLQPFDEDAAVAERGLGLTPGARDRVGQVADIVDHAHPAAAAARRRLDEQRGPEGPAGGHEIVVGAGRAGHDRDAHRARQLPGPFLVPERPHRIRRRPDPHEAGHLDRLREGRVLRQEPVARVYRVGAGVHGRGHQGAGI
jgi:hypothetical protein